MIDNSSYARPYYRITQESITETWFKNKLGQRRRFQIGVPHKAQNIHTGHVFKEIFEFTKNI